LAPGSARPAISAPPLAFTERSTRPGLRCMEHALRSEFATALPTSRSWWSGAARPRKQTAAGLDPPPFVARRQAAAQSAASAI
jgi:hypothetical protein